MSTPKGWMMIGLLAGAAALAIGWKHHAATTLRAEIAREAETAQSFAAIRAEHERLAAALRVAGGTERPSPDAEALARARNDVAELRRATERATAEKAAAAPERFAVGDKIPASEWKNAGTATPRATLETALWAGAGGEVKAFARTLHFIDPSTERAAKDLLANQPEAFRLAHPSPEEFIAILSVRDVPLGAAQVRQFNPALDGWPAPAAQLDVLLTNAEGETRQANLLFMKQGEEWKLLVTKAVVAKYAAALNGAAPTDEK